MTTRYRCHALTIGIALAALAVLPGGALGQGDAEPAMVLIAYHSVEGHTRAMAEAVQKGAQSIEGVEVVLRPVDQATIADVLAADAVILGSPVYNANVAPAVQAFINTWPLRGAPLKNKLGAAFVSAGGISAGEETTQLSLLRSMLIFQMIVVGGPAWKQAFGASAVVSEGPFRSSDSRLVDPLFLAKAEALGRRVAGLAVGWKKVAEP